MRLAAPATLILSTLLAACASAPQVERIVIDDSYTTVLRKVALVQPAQRPLFQPIQAITARSCQRMNTERLASEEDGLAQLKIKADRLGGNAVADVRCTAESASQLTTNCWTSVLCTGTAGRLQP